MQILKEAPECYIQQCEYCGAVLKYSECDINIRNKTFEIKNSDGSVLSPNCICSYDSFVCPSCCGVNEAKRKWMIE